MSSKTLALVTEVLKIQEVVHDLESSNAQFRNTNRLLREARRSDKHRTRDLRRTNNELRAQNDYLTAELGEFLDITGSAGYPEAQQYVASLMHLIGDLRDLLGFSPDDTMRDLRDEVARLRYIAENEGAL